MNIKKPIINIIWNKRNVTKILNEYILSLTYTDYLKGQSDELTLKLINPENLFNNDWYPQKGDKIQAQIGYSGQKMLNCGTFSIDEPEFEFLREGDFVTIKSLGASINEKVREVNSRPFDNKTLVQIAREIGKKHGFEVRGTQGHYKIARVSQYRESDLAFLARISSQYGYIFKLTDNILTFTRVADIEQAEPLSFITRKNIKSLRLRDSSTKTYNACSVKYQNPKTGKLVSYTAKTETTGTKRETLKLNETCATKQEAVSRANAGLKSGQITVSGSIELMEGNPYFMAGSMHTLSGFGKLDGRYKVNQTSHEVTKDDWSISGEIEKNG